MIRKLFTCFFIATFLGGFFLLVVPSVFARNEEECHAALNRCDQDHGDFDGRWSCYRQLKEHAIDWFNTCNETDVYGHLRYADSWSYHNLPEDFPFNCFECIAWIEDHGPQNRDHLRGTRCIDSARVCTAEMIELVYRAEEGGNSGPPVPPADPNNKCQTCKSNCERRAQTERRGGDESWINNCVHTITGCDGCATNSKQDTLALNNFNSFQTIPGGFGYSDKNNHMDINAFIGDVLSIGSALFGGLAVLKIIFGGVMYATAAGNAQRIADAKSHILYALIGIALIAGANVILWLFGATNNIPTP